MSGNQFLLPLDAGFKVYTSANAPNIYFKIFARLLAIDLLWQVKVEFDRVKCKVLVKSGVNMELSHD